MRPSEEKPNERSYSGPKLSAKRTPHTYDKRLKVSSFSAAASVELTKSTRALDNRHWRLAPFSKVVEFLGGERLPVADMPRTDRADRRDPEAPKPPEAF